GAVIHGGSATLRKALVVAQVSLSLLLLIGAGLFIQSLQNLKAINPGFDVHNLVAVDVNPTLQRLDRTWLTDYYRRLDEALNGLPGVESATIATVPLLQGDEWDSWVTIEGYTAKPDERPDWYNQYCTPGYFKTLKIPILSGRAFTNQDVNGAPKVAIVNQKVVNRYFGGKDPVGRHIGFGIDPGTKLDITIVGVAGDTRYESMRDQIPYEIYVPLAQSGSNGATAYIRTHGDPTHTFNTVRSAIQNVDAGVPIFDLRTLDHTLEISMLSERLLATLSSVFGSLATLLAALGLYGVMAFMVARRTREIGIRMALGAAQTSILWMVLRETMMLAALGASIGLAGAWAVTRLIQTQLFGVQPTDLLTMAIASLGIAAVTIVAGYIPARRATTVDPMRALRWE